MRTAIGIAPTRNAVGVDRQRIRPRRIEMQRRTRHKRRTVRIGTACQDDLAAVDAELAARTGRTHDRQRTGRILDTGDALVHAEGTLSERIAEFSRAARRHLELHAARKTYTLKNGRKRNCRRQNES